MSLFVTGLESSGPGLCQLVAGQPDPTAEPDPTGESGPAREAGQAGEAGWSPRAGLTAARRSVEPSDVIEDVAGVPHSRHGQQYQTGRRECDQHPQLPRHSLTAPYSLRSPV
jgi:hypothetical protein